MADETTLAQHQSFSDFVRTHQGLVVGGGVVAILVLAGMFMRSKSPSTPVTSATGDLTGLTGGNLVYVPTQTTFSTQNESGIFASNDPNLTSISSGPVNSPTSTTTTNNPPRPPVPPWRKPPLRRPPGPPTRNPPPPVPKPPVPAGKALRWDSRHTIRGGETLSSIAAAQTRTLRAQGMPGNMTLTWHDLYAHNTAVITKYANQHGYRQDVWNWVFPGETITVPRWG